MCVRQSYRLHQYGVIFLLLLAGCSATPQTRSVLSEPAANWAARLEHHQVPFFPQDAYQCGPAALATILTHSGVPVSAEEMVPKIYVPGRQGSFQVEILAATRASGRIPLIIDANMSSLLDWLNAGLPVLVMQNLGLSWYPVWHYAVVIGYDLTEEEILLRSGTIQRYSTDMALFERTWRRSAFWGLVAVKPGELPLAQNESRYFQAMAAYEVNASPRDQEQGWLAGIRQWPESVLIQMGYGNHLLQSGDARQAEAAYHRVIELDPNYGPAYNNLSEALILQKKNQSALDWIQRAIDIDPVNRDFYQKTREQILERIEIE